MTSSLSIGLASSPVALLRRNVVSVLTVPPLRNLGAAALGLTRWTVQVVVALSGVSSAKETIAPWGLRVQEKTRKRAAWRFSNLFGVASRRFVSIGSPGSGPRKNSWLLPTR